MIVSRWCTCGHNSRDHARTRGRVCRMTQFVTANGKTTKRLCGCLHFTPKETRESGHPAGRAPEVTQ